MNPPQHPVRHSIFLILFFLLIVNIFFLDIWVGLKFRTINERQLTQEKKTVSTTLPSQSKNNSCPDSCLSAIDETVASLKVKTQSVTSSVPTPSLSSQQTDGVKEFFVPLGSGSSSSDDWADVPGVKATVDSTKYGSIQKVLFEGSVHVPNANEIVEVRLYNESDKHTMWGSELFFPSATTQNFLVSKPIALDKGVKTYKVQMKTQLKFPASLDQARIHITIY